jgi:hypothetical protein
VGAARPLPTGGAGFAGDDAGVPHTPVHYARDLQHFHQPGDLSNKQRNRLLHALHGNVNRQGAARFPDPAEDLIAAAAAQPALDPEPAVSRTRVGIHHTETRRLMAERLAVQKGHVVLVLTAEVSVL